MSVAAPEFVQQLDRPAQGRDHRTAAAAAIEMPSYAAQPETFELLLEVVRQLLGGRVAFPRQGCAGPTHEHLDAASGRLDAPVVHRTPGRSVLAPSGPAATLAFG